MSFEMYTHAMDINGFRYEYRALFQLSLDEGNVGKWRDLVMGLPVPRDSFYPELTARLTELSEESITIERARILLWPHRPAREGGITTMADLFDALNWLIFEHLRLRPPMVLWTDNDDLDEVAACVITTFIGGPDNQFADFLSRHVRM